MPTQQTQAIFLIVFSALHNSLKTILKKLTDHGGSTETKDDICHFHSKRVGKILLERDAENFTRINITLTNDRKNIFMGGRLTLGDRDRNPGLGTMIDPHWARQKN